MSYLTVFVELFRFIKRYRERQAAAAEVARRERADERAHQLALIDSVFKRLAEGEQARSAGLVAIADAIAQQAGTINTWLEGFKLADPSPTPSQTVTEEDEWRKEAFGEAAEMVAKLPAEFQMAFLADRMDNFDQELEERDE
jgi:hypothetical protein